MAAASGLNIVGFASAAPLTYAPTLSTLAPVSSTSTAPVPPSNAPNLQPGATQIPVSFDTVYVDTIKYRQQTQLIGPFASSVSGRLGDPVTGKVTLSKSDPVYGPACGIATITDPSFTDTTMFTFSMEGVPDVLTRFLTGPTADVYFEQASSTTLSVPTAAAGVTLPVVAAGGDIPVTAALFGAAPLDNIVIGEWDTTKASVYAYAIGQFDWSPGTASWRIVGPSGATIRWTVLGQV